MADLVKGTDSVLEPGCGPSVLPTYLEANTTYRGFDLNEGFIRHARKKKLDVWVGNVLEKHNYKENEAVVACDVFHHLSPKDRETFISHCYVSCGKFFIICEPFYIYNSSFIKKTARKFGAWLDSDGINKIKGENYLHYRQLKREIKNGFGVIPKTVKRKTKMIGDDLVTIFYKN